MLPAIANRISASRRAPAAFRMAARRVSKSLDTRRGVPMNANRDASRCVRVAASADIHAASGDSDRVREAFAHVAESADLVLLAGDLTQHGEVDEARVVADACRDLSIPVVAVLGNHDWQSDRTSDLARTLSEAGIVVLERAHTILPVRGVSVGIAAVKGFVGGFEYGWANFGEPLFRQAYAETTTDVEA